MRLHIGRCSKTAALPEAAFGLSRFVLDEFLLREAERRGASVVKAAAQTPQVIAHGRKSLLARGSRLFGFKAHFTGPVDDAVELFFFRGCYIGLNCIEGHKTNVCGLGPERVLRDVAFDVDALLSCSPRLLERTSPLQRATDWYFTGPLELRHRLQEQNGVQYLAGDALSFVDPFTGSGILSALLTGWSAGDCAGKGLPVDHHRKACRAILQRPYGVSALLRSIAGTRVAGQLAQLVPTELLFRWTRPRLVA